MGEAERLPFLLGKWAAACDGKAAGPCVSWLSRSVSSSCKDRQVLARRVLGCEEGVGILGPLVHCQQKPKDFNPCF